MIIVCNKIRQKRKLNKHNVQFIFLKKKNNQKTARDHFNFACDIH